ncbi:MAG TPA: N-formylglutamate amidohydrolase [Dongiaceae bacterium]|nr:N-formylglutamate amidohydrolase [Dongiaceae bacterium]
MTTQTGGAAPGLLAVGDPPPFEIVNPEGKARLVLISDHAGRAIPQRLGTLGLSQAELDQHIGWDIGIGAMARRMALALDAPAIIAGYSRLVIDCNRRLDDPTSIAQESDRIPVPGNRGLSAADRQARADAIFRPYHRAIDETIAAKRSGGVVPAIVSLHSFTPRMNGFARPWHVGVLWNRDPRLPVPLMARLLQEPGIVVGDNEPYSGRDEHGYSMPAHAEVPGLPHALFEVRQDQIGHEAGIVAWADRLTRVLREVLADERVYRPQG